MISPFAPTITYLMIFHPAAAAATKEDEDAKKPAGSDDESGLEEKGGVASTLKPLILSEMILNLKLLNYPIILSIY